MWWMAAAQGAMQIGSSVAGHFAEKDRVRAQRKMQEYRNKMTRLAAGQSQNAITTNVTQAIQASARSAVTIQSKTSAAEGSVAVGAATAGTRGASVLQALKGVERAGASAQAKRERQLEAAFLKADNQRRNIQMQAVMQQDNSFIQEPSLAGALLGAAPKVASSAMSAYGQYDAMETDTPVDNNYGEY